MTDAGLRVERVRLRPALAAPAPAARRPPGGRPMADPTTARRTASDDGPDARRRVLRRHGHAGPGPLVVPGAPGARDRAAGGARWPPVALVIDVGCGTGDNLGALEALTGRTVVGVELSPYAIRHAPPRRAGAVRVGVSRAEHLPFATGSADLITSMDVIEHLDDDAALAEYHRVVRPGGLVLLTVPAYPWLWSHHDDWAAHLRRYTRPTLLDAVTRAGLRPRAHDLLQLVPRAAGRGHATDTRPPAHHRRAGRGRRREPAGRSRDDHARVRRAPVGRAGAAACRSACRSSRWPSGPDDAGARADRRPSTGDPVSRPRRSRGSGGRRRRWPPTGAARSATVVSWVMIQNRRVRMPSTTVAATSAGSRPPSTRPWTTLRIPSAAASGSPSSRRRRRSTRPAQARRASGHHADVGRAVALGVVDAGAHPLGAQHRDADAGRPHDLQVEVQRLGERHDAVLGGVVRAP